MSMSMFADKRLYLVLDAVDEDLARQTRAQGCTCGGRLHSARYPRKPRGGPANLPDGYSRRHSFCCSQHGCRCRATPPSVRFLGRKVYLGVVVLLATALRTGPTPARVARLREHIGEVSLRTLQRWRDFWRETFVETDLWRSVRGRFMPPLDESLLPLTLLERFEGGHELEQALRFVAPMTTRLRPMNLAWGAAF